MKTVHCTDEVFEYVPNRVGLLLHFLLSQFEMRATHALAVFQLNLNNSFTSSEHARQMGCNRLNLANKLISIIIIMAIAIIAFESACYQCQKPQKSSGKYSTTCIRGF